ncbi:leucyl/phenylalanyl-tRNA--protein transferase [Cellulophaga sp. 20_2_10]|uniref:leucyl/phenylalanyl-tRNA--protein transferase n=1 Tax=Cellulophaga sp. 20_2_10 TaxID=2942476 RepID=UPI00201A5B76|nr:leucyl/phenylalanyl-tRNA--protein transferase [Cellulophaga sp. 20_2_10]MCL5246722.1 leucyl/phenylalanyl-tRNA--protein transferase [Cellulophaga sp. 20_2_10]
MVHPIYYLTDKLEFPPVHTANEDGLVAAGGDLSVERLQLAYKSGIFPWFDDDRLLLWWSPDPRMVLFPQELKVSKSMRKLLRDEAFTVTKNKNFEEVIHRCATVPRDGQPGTWITQNMQNAYIELHKKGIAHSYEVWLDNQLVGGLYGIDLGTVFCGESMFSDVSNASKYGFITMVQEMQANNYKLIDCQVYTQHLESLGAREIDRDYFMEFLK